MSPSARLVIGLFFLFVIIYMARGVYGFLQQDVGITTLRLGNVERAESVPGVIIRHEEVYISDRDGRIAFDVPDFERVRRGDLVASVMDIDAVTRLEHDMTLLNREIIGVHEMRAATTTDPHVGRVNASLSNRLDRHAPNNMQMNMSEMYTLLSTLTQITDNRNQMITTGAVGARADLTRRHGHLNEMFLMSSSDIYATRTGIMSPLIDTFENKYGFTPDTMRTLTREQVRMSPPMDTIIPGREIYLGDEIFKIVGNTWYIASWMPHEMVHGFSQGDARVLYLENEITGRFERVPVRVEHLNATHRDTFVIFRTTHNVIEFLNQRSVNIRLTDNVQSGFMVPMSAIATRRFYRIPRSHIHGTEDFPTVMHRLETGNAFVPVIISEMSDTHAYILDYNFPLTIGATLVPIVADPPYLILPLGEYHTSAVRGVYRARLNVTRFVEVDIDGEAPEAGSHVLIDPARNPHMLQFDTIITDASMVRENQVVR